MVSFAEMSEIQLYDFQRESTDRVRDATKRHKAILLCMPTGAGKSICAADMIAGAYRKGKTCWLMAPRKELLRQMSSTLETFNIPHGIIGAGYSPDPFAKVNAVMAQTAARRMDKLKPPQILFVDECHFFGPEVERIIRWVLDAGGWVIGLSATPMKTNGRAMGDIYDVLIEGPTVSDLIGMKRLANYRYFAPNLPDLSGIATAGGDYAKGQLSSFMEGQSVIVGDAIKHWKAKADGLITVGFATSRKHAGLMADSFNAAGIRSAMIDGTMDNDQRKRVIMALARGEISVLWSVALLCFGFDLSISAGMDVRVKAVIDCSPTKSLPWQCQKYGRALRYDEQDAIFLDHAGNAHRHGLPDDDREWSLDGKAKRAGNSEPTIPVRQCPRCYHVTRPSPACPACGFVHPIASRTVEEVEGELAEVTERARKVAVRREQGRAQTLDDLLAVAAREGRKPGWARHVYEARQRKRAGR